MLTINSIKSWEEWIFSLNVSSQDCLIVRNTLTFIKEFTVDFQLKAESEFFFACLLIHLLQLEHINILFSDTNALETELFYWLNIEDTEHKNFVEIFLSLKDCLFHYKKIVSHDVNLCSPLIHENHNFIYLRKNYLLQKEFLDIFKTKFLTREKETYFPYLILSDENKADILQSLHTHLEISNELLKAIDIIHQNDLLILIGGPGTGKTTALSVILRTLLSKTHLAQRTPALKIILAAPTGRAQARIIENLQNILTKEELEFFKEIPIQAFTLHSLLEYPPNRIIQKNPPLLCADIVVVDEMSMVDIRLFIKLLQSLPQKCKLILIGDPYQLPSVNPGSIFRDMLQHIFSNPLHLLNPFTAQLFKNHRSIQNSKLYNFVNNIFTTSLDNIAQYMGTADQIFHSEILIINLETTSIAALISLLKKLYITNHHANSFGEWSDELHCISNEQSQKIDSLLKIFENTCILSAKRKNDPLSSDELNLLFTQQQGSLKRLSHGTPIMVTKNLNIFDLSNGERGIIIQRKDQLIAYFRARNRETWKVIPMNLIINFLEPSYVMTIHKSQGCEFNNVCVILPSQHLDILITRPLFFTAITRAKEKLTLCATPNSLSKILTCQEIDSSRVGKLLIKDQEKPILTDQNTNPNQILLFDS